MTHASSLFLSEEQIRTLVPPRLPRRRDERYMGGAMHGRLESEFSEEEQECLRALYADLGELMELAGKRDRAEEWGDLPGPELGRFASRTVIVQAVSDLEKFEQAARATYDTKMANLFRELADGPVASLCAILFLVGSGGVEPEYFQTLFFLARDERKIMRSILLDLDPEGRAKDEEVNRHSIDLLLEKWQNTIYRAFDVEMEVAFDSNVRGMVAERCVEFAEVDRIFYHLANNSLRYGSGKQLAIQVIDTADGEDLVWVFSNPISENQFSRLQNLADGRESVFEYGVGDGSGVGLGSLAESVANAYGIESAAQAVSAGYVGSALEDKIFRIWFHWPKA